jgi:multiple antibiotic resistance protein
MLAGPGTISLLISYQQEFHLMADQIILVITIVFTSCTIYLVLRSSFLIVKGLGASGLNALSRIIGFIVIAIGVEYIINGSLGILEPFLKGLKE